MLAYKMCCSSSRKRYPSSPSVETALISWLWCCVCFTSSTFSSQAAPLWGHTFPRPGDASSCLGTVMKGSVSHWFGTHDLILYPDSQLALETVGWVLNYFPTMWLLCIFLYLTSIVVWMEKWTNSIILIQLLSFLNFLIWDYLAYLFKY